MTKVNKASDFLEKEFKLPVFVDDIQKDEIKNNKSFFLIEQEGNIRKAGNISYSVEMLVYFITREEKQIDSFKLIKGIEDCGFIFSNSDVDFGKLKNTDGTALMRTYVFNQNKRICR